MDCLCERDRKTLEYEGSGPRLVNRDEEDPIQGKADEAGPEWVESHAVLCRVVLYPAGVITGSLSVSEICRR